MDEKTEEKTAEETATATEAAAVETKKAEEAAAAEAAGEVDYEQRYKDLQAEQTRTSQANADLTKRLDQLEHPEPEPEEDLELDDSGFVDRKAVTQIVNAAVQKAVSQVRTQSADTYFRKTYPSLVKYENAIAGIMRSPRDPAKLKGASPEERIDAAVKEFNELTEDAKATATAEAEAKAKEKEEAKNKASGLETSSTTPSKGDEEDVSDEQELANRKVQSAKRRGLA